MEGSAERGRWTGVILALPEAPKWRFKPDIRLLAGPRFRREAGGGASAGSANVSLKRMELCRCLPFSSAGSGVLLIPGFFGGLYRYENKPLKSESQNGPEWANWKADCIIMAKRDVRMSPAGVWKMRKVLLANVFATNGLGRKALYALAAMALAFCWTSTARADGGTDPVGFCAPPATVSACTTGTGIGKETIPVGATLIGMEKNGNGTSDSPWFLLVAVPDYTGAAPTLSIAGFTEGTVNSASFASGASGSIYDLFSIVGDSSMNSSNLFGANEVAVLGSAPASFEVFEYSFTGAFDSNVPYVITVTGGLNAGTFLAASGGSNPFSTPYTTAGLVGGVNTPEPASLTMLGAGLLGLALLAKRRALTV